jgi:hypothetical protein
MKEAEAQSDPLITKTNAGAEIPEEEMEELMESLMAPSKVTMWLRRMTAKREESILDRWLKRMETTDPAILFPPADQIRREGAGT